MQKSSLTTPNKTAPTTAEPSPAQQAQQQQQKAKKQVKWDSDILEESESESDEEEEEKTNTRQASRKYHAAHDANYDTIVQGLALNDLEDSEESEGDDDIVDFDDTPYKRRKTNFGNFSYGQRAYGPEAKKIEKEKASIGCQRFCLLIKFMKAEQQRLIQKHDQQISILLERISTQVNAEALKNLKTLLSKRS